MLKRIRCFFVGHRWNFNYCEKCECCYSVRDFTFTLKDLILNVKNIYKSIKNLFISRIN